jgi:hypothetical protein
VLWRATWVAPFWLTPSWTARVEARSGGQVVVVWVGTLYPTHDDETVMDGAPIFLGDERELVVGVVVFFDEGDGAYYVVGDGLAVGGLDGGAHGGALPLGAGADGPGGRGLGPGRDDFLDHGFVGAELGDDGDDSALAGRGDAAVGAVVAEPDDFGDFGVVVGEVEGGDVAGDAVDHEPGGGLPGPARGFGGERIVDVEGAADDEGPVGDVVDFADGPLFLVAVDEEAADVEAGGFLRFVVGVGFGRGVGDATRGAEGDAVDLGGLGGGGERAGEKQEQWH